MRICLVVVTLAAFVLPLVGAEDAEALVKELLKLAREAEPILKSVKDRACLSPSDARSLSRRSIRRARIRR